MVKLQSRYGLPFCNIKLTYKGNGIVGMDFLKAVGAVIDLNKMEIKR